MARKKKRRKKYRGFWRFIKFQIFLMCLVLAGVAYYYLGGYAKQIKELQAEAEHYVRTSTVDTFKTSQTGIVYDANGNQISVLKGEKDVYYLPYDEIPTNVTAAIVSIEDKKFYKHGGVDYKAIMRAVFAMLKNGEVTQGGSTITQQLARNVFISQERTWQRKMEEIFIALRLEKKYTKNEILEFYLNNIYFANGYYGIQAASKGYFNVTVDQLDLSQVAFLCAIPNSPSRYDPVTNIEKTIERRNLILQNMLDDGKITKSAYDTAVTEQIVLNRPQTKKNDYVETYTYHCATRALMQQQGFQFRYDFSSEADKAAYDEMYNDAYTACQRTLYTAGYRIYTSLDLNLQSMLQQSIDENLSAYTEVGDDGIYDLQASAVCIDNENGYVRAIVGGRSQEVSGYTLNRAYQSFRQPGSSIKPLIVYTPILERGYTPDSIVTDEKIEDGPSNADKSYAGDMTLREAVKRSKNTIAWSLFEELTPKVGISYLKRMNFSKLEMQDEQMAASLGGFTRGVSALEMASGYAAIENDGNYREPTCIVKITDADGNDVYTSKQEEVTIYKENAARAMTDMLVSVVTEGTGKGLAISEMPCAGKTGTTNDNKDGWFVGYTRYYTTSVWVGYDMPKKLPTLKGSSYPGAIWHDFMENVHTGYTPMEFLPYNSYSDRNKKDEETKNANKEKTKEEKAEEKQAEQNVTPETPENETPEQNAQPQAPVETPQQQPQTPSPENQQPQPSPESPQQQPTSSPENQQEAENNNSPGTPDNQSPSNQPADGNTPEGENPAEGTNQPTDGNGASTDQNVQPQSLPEGGMSQQTPVDNSQTGN